MTVRPALRRVLVVLAVAIAWNAVLLLPFASKIVPSVMAANPPTIWLPTPVGQTWKVTQGFGCGSHVGNQARSLDLVNQSGSTMGAPVRAAASGITFVWEAATGTIILSHGNGYYTLYSHLSSVITTRRGLAVQQGDVIGRAGRTGTGAPHIHFNFFYAPDSGAYNRTPINLDFADGYDFNYDRGCNQHFGRTVIAQEPVDIDPPTIDFASEAQPGAWYCADETVAFQIRDDRSVRGFQQAFNNEPDERNDELPGDYGSVSITWEGEGMHTFYVRGWDATGKQALASFGPVGYDATPPMLAPSATNVTSFAANTPFTLAWTPANDGTGSGVKGYKIYVGTDPEGTSDWFVDQAQIGIEGKEPGNYVLRVQAFDNACGVSEWTTLQEFTIE